MNKKKNPIVFVIIGLILVLCLMLFLYFKPESSSTETDTDSNIKTVSAITTTIENTLSNSGQISSELDEKVKLHASYYFESLLVEENLLIEEGTNIIEYTNGTYLTAPYDCVLISSNLPNEDEICTSEHYIEIQSIDTLCMSLSISESDINKVEIGDEVDITLSANNEKITGYITKISEIGTYSSSGSYFTATVTFENNGNLKIGMSATCEIIIEKAENVIAVPNEAVQTANNQSYVVVVNSDGTTENVNIETGISNDAYTEVKSGLTGNETVEMIETESSSSSGFGGGMNFERGSSSSRENMKGGMQSGGGMQGMPSGGSMPSMPGM